MLRTRGRLLDSLLGWGLAASVLVITRMPTQAQACAPPPTDRTQRDSFTRVWPPTIVFDKLIQLEPWLKCWSFYKKQCQKLRYTAESYYCWRKNCELLQKAYLTQRWQWNCGVFCECHRKIETIFENSLAMNKEYRWIRNMNKTRVKNLLTLSL